MDTVGGVKVKEGQSLGGCNEDQRRETLSGGSFSVRFHPSWLRAPQTVPGMMFWVKRKGWEEGWRDVQRKGSDVVK